MPSSIRQAVLIAVSLTCGAGVARAVVLGGGLVRSDCTVAFEGVDATNADSGVVCHDGDSTCDADGAIDGVCHFAVRVCAHTSAPGCSPAAVTGVQPGGIPFALPDVPVSSETCGPDDPLTVPMDTAVGATLLARQSGSLKDVDYLNLCCRGTTSTLDAALCATDVELAIADCQRPPRKTLETLWHTARTLVRQADKEPSRSAKLLKKAVRVLTRLQTRARHLASSDDCGNSIGLMASYAAGTIPRP